MNRGGGGGGFNLQEHQQLLLLQQQQQQLQRLQQQQQQQLRHPSSSAAEDLAQAANFMAHQAQLVDQATASQAAAAAAAGGAAGVPQASPFLPSSSSPPFFLGAPAPLGTTTTTTTTITTTTNTPALHLGPSPSLLNPQNPPPPVVFVNLVEKKEPASGKPPRTYRGSSHGHYIIRFFLVDSTGGHHHCVTGVDNGDSHYEYTQEAGFPALHCHNKVDVKTWADAIIARSQDRAGFHTDIIQDPLPPAGTPVALPKFISYSQRKEVVADGRHLLHWYLLDDQGHNHLALTGEETETRDGHYKYHTEGIFNFVGAPLDARNQDVVRRWLDSMVVSSKQLPPSPSPLSLSQQHQKQQQKGVTIGVAGGGTVTGGMMNSSRNPTTTKAATAAATSPVVVTTSKRVAPSPSPARPPPPPSSRGAAASPQMYIQQQQQQQQQLSSRGGAAAAAAAGLPLAPTPMSLRTAAQRAAAARSNQYMKLTGTGGSRGGAGGGKYSTPSAAGGGGASGSGRRGRGRGRGPGRPPRSAFAGAGSGGGVGNAGIVGGGGGIFSGGSQPVGGGAGYTGSDALLRQATGNMSKRGRGGWKHVDPDRDSRELIAAELRRWAQEEIVRRETTKNEALAYAEDALPAGDAAVVLRVLPALQHAVKEDLSQRHSLVSAISALREVAHLRVTLALISYPGLKAAVAALVKVDQHDVAALAASTLESWLRAAVAYVAVLSEPRYVQDPRPVLESLVADGNRFDQVVTAITHRTLKNQDSLSIGGGGGGGSGIFMSPATTAGGGGGGGGLSAAQGGGGGITGTQDTPGTSVGGGGGDDDEEMFVIGGGGGNGGEEMLESMPSGALLDAPMAVLPGDDGAVILPPFQQQLAQEGCEFYGDAINNAHPFIAVDEEGEVKGTEDVTMSTAEGPETPAVVVEPGEMKELLSEVIRLNGGGGANDIFVEETEKEEEVLDWERNAVHGEILKLFLDAPQHFQQQVVATVRQERGWCAASDSADLVDSEAAQAGTAASDVFLMF